MNIHTNDQRLEFEVQYLNDETGAEYGRLFSTKAQADAFIKHRGIRNHQIMYYGWSAVEQD